MKKVFNSNAQLSHAWANQLQDEGRGSNMFFEGPAIYSYGYHYEIARFVIANNNEKVCFVNSNGYSNTTAKHTNHVHNAIPDGIKVFKVPFNSSNKLNIDLLTDVVSKLIEKVDQQLTQQLKARSDFKFFYDAYQNFEAIIEICELFGIEKPLYPTDWEAAKLKSKHLRETKKEREEKKAAKKLEKSIELLTKWLNHEYNGQLYDIPVHLRISKDGQLIETTKGAKVDKLEALKLLFKLRKGENVNGYKLDGFTVIENNNEAVKIGCHTISWNIINQIF